MDHWWLDYMTFGSVQWPSCSPSSWWQRCPKVWVIQQWPSDFYDHWHQISLLIWFHIIILFDLDNLKGYLWWARVRSCAFVRWSLRGEGENISFRGWLYGCSKGFVRFLCGLYMIGITLDFLIEFGEVFGRILFFLLNDDYVV